MRESAYVSIYQFEDTHWWYRGIHSFVITSIKKLLSIKNPMLCDAGCGTGGLLQRLKREGFLNSYGFDISSYALQQLRKRKYICKRVWQGNVEQLALHNSFFDVITCMGVLYHLNVHNEKEVLEEFFRVLKPKGICILQLPAFEFLRGSHDIAIMTRKRYRVGEVEKCVREAGFKIELCSYDNSWFFPIMLVWRLLNRLGMGRKKMNHSLDLAKFPKAINTLFYTVIKMENYLLNKIRFPFGTSIFCIARKVIS